MRASCRSSLVAVVAFAALALPACTLDFDHFDPHATDAAAKPDVATKDDAPDAAETSDAEEDAATEAAPPNPASDDAGDGGGPTDAMATTDASDAAACTPSASCLSTADSCGKTCSQTEQQCVSKCSSNNCRNGCTRTENTCVTQCSNTCATCTETAGCRATSSCTTAAKP